MDPQIRTPITTLCRTRGATARWLIFDERRMFLSGVSLLSSTFDMVKMELSSGKYASNSVREKDIFKVFLWARGMASSNFRAISLYLPDFESYRKIIEAEASINWLVTSHTV